MTDETRELHTMERREAPQDRRSNFRRASDLYRRDNAYVLLRDLDNILQQLKQEIIDREEATWGTDAYVEGLLSCRTRVAEAVDQYRRSAS